MRRHCWLLLPLLIAACSDGEPDPTGTSLPGLGEAGAGGSAEVSCTDDTRVEQFESGLSRTGEQGFTITIEQGEPAVPARGDNTWTVTVLDGAGEPLAGAQLVVAARMPDHGHMSPSTPMAT